MTDGRILAIDVGTQSVRAIAFDGIGSVVAGSRIPIEPYVAAHPGWAEQDPDVYWKAIGAACDRLWAGGGVEPASIAAVTMTTQRGTVVVTDASGRPLRPAITWLDQRRAEGIERIGGVTGLAFRALGVRDTVAAFQAECEANWLARHEPETWQRASRYLLLSGYLTFRMTAQFVDSVAAQVGYVPFDFKRLAWARPGDWRWRVAPIEPSWLPTLVPPTGVLGEVTDDAALVLGVRAGLPVIAAAADKACEMLGSGATTSHIAALSYGTAATVNVLTDRYREAIPLVPPYPAAMPGAWAIERQIYRGYWLVEWFKREFGDREVARAERAGVAPETYFDELVTASPPGALGLMLQPTWSPGVRVPGPEAKGAIIGFGAVHTRAHLYRAILEGLAYGLRDGAERAERRTGVPIREVRVAGGGSQSTAAVQLTADVFGLPVSRAHTHETSALGAAIDAATGLGWYSSVADAAAGMVRTRDTHEPDAAAHAVYDELYRRVYRRMYDRLRPLYEEIRRITRYPT